MTRTQKPAPLRLKWEPTYFKMDGFRLDWMIVPRIASVGFHKASGRWCWRALDYQGAGMNYASQEEAQAEAEAYIRARAKKMVAEAEALWPGILEEVVKERAK